MRTLRMLAPIINILPERIIRYISSKVSEFLLNKYVKLEVTGNELLSERIGKPTI
jgi:1-acyl-sn-glycerol-3-phosphate acyltransferase